MLVSGAPQRARATVLRSSASLVGLREAVAWQPESSHPSPTVYQIPLIGKDKVRHSSVASPSPSSLFGQQPLILWVLTTWLRT
jgi:hypothetical protein